MSISIGLCVHVNGVVCLSIGLCDHVNNELFILVSLHQKNRICICNILFNYPDIMDVSVTKSLYYRNWRFCKTDRCRLSATNVTKLLCEQSTEARDKQHCDITLYATRFAKETNLGNVRKHATTHIYNMMHTSTA